jgi:hypothetical protein
MEYLKIKVDEESGEAKLIATAAFHAENGLFKLDVLQDVIRSAERMYARAQRQFTEFGALRHEG